MINFNTKMMINEIEIKRDKLNNLVLLGINSDSVLNLSIELDKLINLYYKSIEDTIITNTNIEIENIKINEEYSGLW